MVIISKAVLKGFAEKYPEAETALLKWYNETKAASGRNFSDLKKTFNTADAVAKVFILFFGTHKEYDKIDASRVQFKK